MFKILNPALIKYFSSENRNFIGIALYRFFSRLYFYLPILFPLFIGKGFNLFETELLFASYFIISSLSLKLFETSKISHKKSLLLGEFFRFIGIILIFSTSDFILTLLSQIFMGCGYALIVGKDTLFLQKNNSQNKSINFQNFQSNTNSFMFIALMISGLISAFLYKKHLDFIFYFSLIGVFISIICILILHDKKIFEKVETVNQNSNYDKLPVFYYSIIRAFTLSFFTGILPYILFKIEQVDIFWFCIIILSFTFFGFISSQKISNYFKKKSLYQVFLISILFVLTGFILNIFENIYLTALSTVLLGIISGCVRPTTIFYIQNNHLNLKLHLDKSELFFGILGACILICASLLSWIQFQTLLMIIIGFLLLLLFCFYKFKKVFFKLISI